MLTLYQRSDCPFCWKVRIALAELELDYQSVDTVLGEKHPEVLRLSPTGTVPVLVDAEVVVWESAVILDYLDARFAPGSLLSADPAVQSRERLLQVYSDKQVGGCLKEIVFEKRAKPESEWDAEKIREGAARWRDCQAWLQQQLDGRQYFGSAFSAADCALAARFGVAEAYGAAVNADFPQLLQWYEGVTARPSWQRAYPTSFIRTD